MGWARPNCIARIYGLANAAHAEDSDRLQGSAELILLFLAISRTFVSPTTAARDFRMNTTELAATAHAMVANQRGILAADESTSTIGKRFNTIHLESTEENRRAYREMLFTAPEASQYISGVILFDETIRQKTKDGTPFPTYLAKNKMILGIKVDTGAKPLAGFTGETITEGLDGLRERLAEYYKLGARFAKWRAVIDIGSGIPTAYAIDANAAALARYATLCQEGGVVPIVEPEVLMDGDHTIERCYETTEKVLRTVFNQLYAQRVAFELMI